MNAKKFKAGMPMQVVLLLALAQSMPITITSLKAQRNARAEEW